MTGRRWLTLGLIPAALFAAVVVPMALVWSDLPEPMAVHWSLGGDPNGSLLRLAHLAVMAVLFVAVWWAVIRAISAAPHQAPSYTAGLFFFGGLLAAVQGIIVASNLDKAGWESADEFGGLAALIVVGAGLGGGVLGWFLADRAPAPDPGIRPDLPIDDPGGAVWSSRGSGPVLTVVGYGLIIAGIVTWGWPTVVFAAIGLIVLAAAQVRATVSARGVVVSLGWFGFPSWTVPLGQVTAARLEDVRPMAYGGWGYRVLPGVRAVIVRGGEALRLDRTDKADLVLTVDDAETGAGLINALIQRG